MSIDPVVTDANTGGSFNRYAYVNNSPYKYVDPDGRSPDNAADRFVVDVMRWIGERPNLVRGLEAAAVAADLGASGAVAGTPAKATVAAGGAAAKGAQVAETVAVRTTQAGDKAVRITRADGSVKDISPARVKEYVPNTHPKAPPGTLDKVKFENPLPGSKGFKREPTAEELNVLKEAK